MIFTPVSTAMQRLSGRGRLIVDRASWTLIDQGVVSLGGFVLNVLLARALSGGDYGTFALFMGTVFVLRSLDFSLISYPLSVRLSSLPLGEHPAALANTAALATILSLFLAAALALGAILMGRADLALPVTVCYLAWQAQEMSRRFLTASFRNRDAVWGDATSFIGQIGVIFLLAYLDALTLHSALYALSALFMAGAIVHTSKLLFARPRTAALRALSREHYQLGKWSLLTYEVVLLRTQLFPWVLAILAGTAATASFQAALNIANLMNPVILGIGVVLQQAVAQARLTDGLNGAWRVARGYILFGLAPILIFAAFGLLAPQFALEIVYGVNSPYLDLANCVQLLVFAGACEYLGEMIAKTLLAVERGGSAFFVNSTGAIVAILAVPMVIPFGVVGACAALAIANLARLIFAWLLLHWLVIREVAAPGMAAEAQASGS
jgi:O-antigen/teichoic acid export membrane protein